MTQKAFEIFKAGTHTTMGGQKLKFTQDDLVLTAATYALTGRKAPLHLGHQPDGAPAYGLVSSMTVKDGRLVATADFAEPLVKLIKAGSYKNVSASFFTPGRPENPYPRAWTLRHVAFLGAHPPAVKGLKEIEFSESSSASYVEFSAPSLNLLPANFSIYTFHRIAVELQAINPGLSYEDSISIAQNSNPFQESH